MDMWIKGISRLRRERMMVTIEREVSSFNEEAFVDVVEAHF